MREEDTNSGSFLDKEKRKGLRVKVVDEKKKRKKRCKIKKGRWNEVCSQGNMTIFWRRKENEKSEGVE